MLVGSLCLGQYSGLIRASLFGACLAPRDPAKAYRRNDKTVGQLQSYDWTDSYLSLFVSGNKQAYQTACHKMAPVQNISVPECLPTHLPHPTPVNILQSAQPSAPPPPRRTISTAAKGSLQKNPQKNKNNSLLSLLSMEALSLAEHSIRTPHKVIKSERPNNERHTASDSLSFTPPRTWLGPRDQIFSNSCTCVASSVNARLCTRFQERKYRYRRFGVRFLVHCR